MTTHSPEHIASHLRHRAANGNLALTKADLTRIAAMLEKLSSRCAEAYQVVGSLAAAAGAFRDPAVQKALILLSNPMRRGAMLPFVTAKDRASAGTKTGRTLGKVVLAKKKS